MKRFILLLAILLVGFSFGEFVPTALDPIEGQLQCNMCALAVEKLESIMSQGGDQMDLAKLSLQVICDSMYSTPNLYLFCSSVINKILKAEDPKDVCRAIPTCFVIDEPVLNDTIIDLVNKDMERAITENSGDYWEATRNPMFEGVSLSEAKNYLGLLDDLTPFENMIIPEGDVEDIPTSFDSRTQWKDCIHGVRNQGACGSCWAVSAADILSDRYCIKSNGSTNILLSIQDLVSCDKTEYGCQGGFLKNVWNHLAKTGTVLESCFPYKSASGTSPGCPTYAVCPSGVGTWKRYKSKSGSTMRYGTLSAIQKEILTKGPVQAAFTVYQDFYSYKSGIYSYKTGKVVGGHAVRLVGWGVSSGTPYWIVSNSWGKNWGSLSGYFWIKRGVNMCGFEASVYAGQAP